MKQNPNIELMQGDCMDYLATLPNNAFDLAIVDPPYGIGYDGQKKSIKNDVQIRKSHQFKNWDQFRPSKTYFKEVQRVSLNQVIWGGNYFTDFLNPTKAWVFWYKGQQGLTMSDGELAWTSFKKVTRMVNIHRSTMWAENPIHPTQKPVALYKWLLKNYAKEGDRILDTHLGSGSIAIACFDMGFDLTGIELDTEYFEAAKARFNAHARQMQLF